MGHHHDHSPILQDPKRRQRASIILWALLAPVGIIAMVMVIALWPQGNYDRFALNNPMETSEGVNMSTGTVTRTEVEICPSSAGLDEYGGRELECPVTYVMPAHGGAEIQLEVPPETLSSREVKAGGQVRFLDLSQVTGEGVPYIFVDFVRTTPMLRLPSPTPWWWCWWPGGVVAVP